MKLFIAKNLWLILFSFIGTFAYAKKPVAKSIPRSTAKTIPTVPVKVPVGKSDEGDFVIEQRGDGTKVKYKKKTTYDFEGASIDGVYNKPSGSYISNIKDVKAKSIIRVRENFDQEVLDSQRLIK